MKINHYVLLALIVILGFVLRIYLLDKYPPALNWDEVSHGYNAYSILKTGSDEWGKVFPLDNFRAYGDYPLPLNLYLTIPFIAFFGLGEFSIRLPHAILGTLTIIAFYFLSEAIFKNKHLSLLGVFLVAIDPWNLFSSRFVLQSNLSVFFLTASIALFLNREKHKLLLPLSVLSFGLTLFSYHSTRIFTPLFFLAIVFIYRKELVPFFKSYRTTALFTIALAILFFAPLPFILSNPESRARSNWVFLINPGAVNEIENQRNNSSLPETVRHIVYNRPIYLAEHAVSNYFDYYSPKYLFFSGGTQHQFSIPNIGLLYPINSIFFYLGIYYLFRGVLKKDKDYRLLLAWLILAPIPAAITQEKMAVIRSSTMLPLPELLTCLGIFEIGKLLRQSSSYLMSCAYILYIGVLVISLVGYLNLYFGKYATEYSSAWQYGYKEAVSYAADHYQDYDNIIVTKKYGEPHEFFLFYGAMFQSSWAQPESYKSDPGLIRFHQSDWYWVDRFDKFYFVNDWQIPHDTSQFKMESGGVVPVTPKTLLITSPGNYPVGWKVLETIKFLDGKTAFDIVKPS